MSLNRYYWHKRKNLKSFWFFLSLKTPALSNRMDEKLFEGNENKLAMLQREKQPNYGVFSGPYFPVFVLNTEIYAVNLRIQSEYEEIQTRKNSVFRYFHAVLYLSKESAKSMWLKNISMNLWPIFAGESQIVSLREKCPNTEFFLVCIFPYSVWIREEKDQKRLRIWTLFRQIVCI